MGIHYAGVISLNLAEAPVDLLPVLAADAGVAYKHVLGINLTFNLEETLVVLAPESVLPVFLKEGSLETDG